MHRQKPKKRGRMKKSRKAKKTNRKNTRVVKHTEWYHSKKPYKIVYIPLPEFD